MLAQTVSQRRKLLLHLKCLFWCLNQMQTRYNVNLVLHSLEHESIHPEIIDSNLGDNLRYLKDNLDPEDLERIGGSMRHLSQSMVALDMDEKHFEVGHYIQSLNDFGPITAGTYGVIAAVTPQLRGLFYLDGGHLIEAPFAPSDVRVIFGTYLV
jgi:hypothetical protein